MIPEQAAQRAAVLQLDSGNNKHIASITALGRFGLPDDIGPVGSFLYSDIAGQINAQCLEVSGGMML